MSTTEQLLEAGALLAVKQKVKTKEPVDEVSARIYSHVGLATPVVRLVPDNLAQGDDLAMDFLGFEEPDVEGPVCKRRRQALGFPGWALINDPKHARYALELVKSMKKAGRRAKSKPGHAYDEYVATSKKLGRSVAHFLPSYWEEVGRTFIEVGSDTFASRAFNKAREAEKVHALKVDENIRRDVFLEFALAGCLSIKTLTEYGKELQKTLKPEQAWEFFRELCVRRTLGGMPPYAAVKKDLDRILKTTKLDVEKEQVAFLEEIIDSPAIIRAAEGFWDSYVGELKVLADKDPKSAGILLNMIPDWGYWNNAIWSWTEFLDEKLGILSNAWEKGIPKEAGPKGSPAAFFNTRIKRTSPKAFPLLDRMADRLKADKIPVDFSSDGDIEVDLLDYALEIKIPIADPDPKKHSFNLNEWASNGADQPNRPRDPMFIHNDKRFKKLLAEAVPGAAGNSNFEQHAQGKKALKEARRTWLTELVAKIDRSAMPTAIDCISEMQNKTYKSTFREFPKPYESLGKVDLAPVLARSLRGGLLSEYGWPALEAAYEKLDKPDAKERPDITVCGTLPHVIVTDNVTAIVIDRDSVVLEQELPIPKKHELVGIAYVDGRLAIQLRNESSWDYFSCWADEPKKRFKEVSVAMSLEGLTVKLPGGQLFSGQKSYSSTDPEPSVAANDFYFDGKTAWRSGYEWTDSKHWIKELDPVTGNTGRESMPAFFEDFLKSGDTLQFGSSSLFAVGDMVKDSPLGVKDGVIGWRVKTTTKKKVIAEGIDGRKFETDNDGWTDIVGMLDLPGSDKHMLIAGNDFWESGYYGGNPIWSADAEMLLDAQGGFTSTSWVKKLPVLHWHFLQVRDLKTSKRLRKIKDADAAKLIKAGRADLKLKKEKGKPRKFLGIEKELKSLLPDLKDQRFRQSLVHVIRHAAKQQEEIAETIIKKDPDAPDPIVIPNRIEELVQPAWRQLGMYWYREKMFAHLQPVSLYLDGTLPKGETIPEADADWTNIFSGFTGRIWDAVFGERKEGKIPEWIEFLEHWLELPLHKLPGKVRYLSGEFQEKKPLPYDEPEEADGDDDDYDDEAGDLCPTFEQNDNLYVVYKDWSSADLLEYSPKGKFKVPKHYDLQYEKAIETGWDLEKLKQFVATAKEHGTPTIEREKLESIAEQTGISFPEAVRLWYPSVSKELRKELKLKVRELDAAQTALNGLPQEFRNQLQSALFKSGPSAPWTDTDTVVKNIVETWKKNAPRRLALTTEMMTRVPAHDRQLDAMADPGSHPLLSTKTKYSYKYEDGWFQLICKPEDSSLSGDDLALFASTILMINAELPVGDEARAEMPAVVEGVKQALTNVNLLFECGGHYEWQEKSDLRKKLPPLFSKVKSGKEFDEADDGLVSAVANKTNVKMAFYPAKAKSKKDYDRIRNIMNSIGDENEPQNIAATALIRSEGMQAVVDRIKKTPVPDGQYEANPLYSVPKLVAKVAKKLGVSENAAILYLQVLALPEPKTNNIKLWNDWTTSVIKKAVAELIKKKVLLKAKRSRAGRDFFLPGGWEPQKTPHIPLETWKLSLFDIERDINGGLDLPVGRILCLRPLHEQFEAAWKRIEDGDEPAYEEVN